MSYSYSKNLSIKTKTLNSIRKLFCNHFAEKIFIYFGISNTFLTKIIPSEYLYKKGTLRNVNYNGIKYNLDISNVVDHGIYFKYKDNGQIFFTDLFKPNYTIIDIGANIGATVLKYSKLATEGKVFGFEPSKKNFKRLTDHIKLNNISNIVPLNFGLGSEKSTLKLFEVVESNPGMNRILQNQDENFNFEEIEINVLDTWIEENKITKIDCIKIDVEGFEMEVLKGAYRTLEVFKPILFIEVIDSNLKENNSSALDVYNYLSNFNYTIYKAYNKQILNELELQNCQFDILCIPK